MFVSPRHRAIVMPHRDDVARLVPGVQSIAWRGASHLVIPHTTETTRLLRNLGTDAPSPILTDYDWSGQTPWEVQRQTAAMLTTSPRAYVFNQMRTGKTRSVLWALDYLMREGRVRKALIVAPLSTLNLVWGREILTGFAHRRYTVLHGANKKARLARLANDVDFYIINHDGPEVIEKELEARTDIDAVVFDEVAVYREQRTHRWICAKRLTAGRRYVWGLTGAPTPNAPTDAYAIGKLITPERVPRYFKEFQDRTMLKVSQFKYVPKWGSTEIVHDTLRPSVRFTRNDVREAPPTLYMDRECQLSQAAQYVMKGLIDKFRVTVQQGGITAFNAGVLVNKLMQVATGWVYTDDGGVVDVSSPSRLQVVAELFAETDRKVLVFVPYIHAVQGVTAFLRSKGYDVDMVYGDTPTRERDRIFSAFQQTDKYDGLVCHPQCMAHGLTLTAADMAVWFGPPPSNEIYGQANDRIALPGLSYTTAIVHIVGSTAERRRYAGLRKQENLQQTLLGMLEGVNE